MTRKTVKTRQLAKGNKARKKKNLLREIMEIIIPAVIIFLVVRAFFFEARWVPSPSMVPTIKMNERFLENKLVYRFRQPKRGEIIVFHPPASALQGATRRDDLVKRVVGLPGEKWEIINGVVYIDGKALKEDYVPQDEMDYLSFPGGTIPRDSLLALGDNRRQSRDSRYWGYVPLKNVDGKAIWRFWPLNRISLLH